MAKDMRVHFSFPWIFFLAGLTTYKRAFHSVLFNFTEHLLCARHSARFWESLFPSLNFDVEIDMYLLIDS